MHNAFNHPAIARVNLSDMTGDPTQDLVLFTAASNAATERALSQSEQIKQALVGLAHNMGVTFDAVSDAYHDAMRAASFDPPADIKAALPYSGVDFLNLHNMSASPSRIAFKVPRRED